MKRGFLGAAFLSVFGLLGLSTAARADEETGKGAVRKQVQEAKKLAARIDHHIGAVWKGKKVKPAPQSKDAEFFRRVSLDLTGRIPSLTDVRDFLDDDDADKRTLWVEELLEKRP